MPRNTREYLLRYADQALNDLDRALEKLAVLKENYQPTHQKHAEYIEHLAAMIVNSHDLLTRFRSSFM